MHGFIRYVRNMLAEDLDKERDAYARFTVGMLHDMLDRVDHSMDTCPDGLQTPPKLMHATVKVCASCLAIIIVELSKKDQADMAKETALDHLRKEMNIAMELYKGQEKTKDFL